MKTFGQLHTETNALHYEFLKVEMDTALTLLNIAQTTQNHETRARNLQKAGQAHAAVLQSAAGVAMTNQEKEDLQSKLRLFEDRLASLRSSESTDGERAGI